MFVTENVSGMLLDSLRDDYTESKCSFDEDEWPPNQPKTVVNVALIHYKGSRTEQELIEISKRYKEGTPAVDELSHHSRVTKDIYKIFQPDFTNTTDAKPLKLMLIEGAPGIGKTVLAKRIAHLWAKKELLTDVSILFLLFLRDPELQNIKTTEQLIHYLSSKPLDEEEVKNCVQQVKELYVGIVMDGFDEYPIQLRKRSFIADLIRGRVFHNCTIVLTSRPNATINLHDKVDRRVEILGFSQEERDIYISESLESLEQRKQLQGYLKCQPIINGLVYVPLHLAVLLYLFKIQIKLPETLTEMNESFILHTIYRSLTKNKLIPTAVVTAIESIKDLPEYVLNIVNGLSKLAFMGLQNNRLVFTYREIKATCPEIEKDIPGAINGFGLLQVVQHFSKRGVGTTVSFNFLHFTMQEFLAAFYVCDSTKTSYEQQISLMEKTFWKGMYCFMWMMYVGINGVNSRTFMQFLYKDQPDTNTAKLKLSSSVCNELDKIKALHLFQCFMEAKSEKVPKEISNIFYNNEINFNGLRLLPHHISSLILYISKYSMKLEILNLRDCHIGDAGMSILEHYFTANEDKASSIKQIDLFGNNSVLLWNVYCAIFGHQKLTKLNWASLRGVNVEEIVTVMDKNTTVQSLNLSENCFNDNDAERIAEVLSNNTALKELDFSKNKITTKGAIAISDCVHNNIKLQHLKISWNNHFMDTDHPNIDFSQRIINDTDTQIVTKLLCKSETVTKLDLSQNRISNIGAGSISMCIESARSLREIDISRNKISNVGLKKITDALQLNRTVKKLNISHNKISDNGLSAIGECLKSNNTLQEVNVSYNNISRKGIVALSDYLKNNIALTELTVSWNTCKTPLVLDGTNVFCNMSSKQFGDVGTTLISAFLWHKNIILKLNISNNNITDNGAVAISEYLKNNDTLNELDISHNQVSDIGIMTISEALLTSATLQILDISHNNISDDGAAAINKWLIENDTLQQLDISHNQVSNIGTIKISKALQINSALQVLVISHNIITDDGALAIGKILRNNYKDGSMVTEGTELLHENNIQNFTLQKLDVSCNKISSKGIVTFSDYFTNNNTLQELTISWDDCKTPIVLDGTNKLCDMSNVHFGDVGATLISAFLFQKDRILKLNISHNNISNDGAVTISKYLNINNTLQQLDISHNQVSCIGIINISKALLTNISLQILDISHNNISNDGAVAISEYLNNNNTLQQLDLSHNQVSSFGIISNSKALLTNTILQVLDISHNNISDDGALAIGKTLRNSYKGGSMVTKDTEMIHENNIQNFTLQKLNISFNKISSKGIITFSDYLTNNNTLQELTISWDDCKTPIVLDGTNKLCDMSNMHFGDVGATLISAFLFQKDVVLKLNISHNNISNNGAAAISEHLNNNNTLQQLDLSHNQVSSLGIINISKALLTNTTLQILDISHNNISDDGALAIGNIVRNNYKGVSMVTKSTEMIHENNIQNFTLQKLNVSCNKISSKGIVTFSDYLTNNDKLQELIISWDDCKTPIVLDGTNKLCDMSNMHFGDVGATLISAFLFQKDGILKLNISHNNISNDGAVAISEYLNNNNTLQQLDLSHNQVSSLGIINISKALLTNTTLQILDISHNNISDDGALAIGNIVRNNYKGVSVVTKSTEMIHENNIQNFTLQKLNVSCNKISSKGIVTFSDYLTNNDKLQELTISWDDCKTPIVLDGTNKLCNMSNMYFGDVGATLISAFLFQKDVILKLNISHNNISNDGAVAISEYLNNNNTLQQLDLSNNQVSSLGIINISQALLTNTTLQILDISHNNISDDGALAIGKILRQNYKGGSMVIKNTKMANENSIQGFTVQKLNISCNKISSKGIVPFSEYLTNNNTLQKLTISWDDCQTPIVLDGTNKFYNMSNVHFGDVGATLISAFLFQKDVMLELNISHNNISNDGAVAISKYLNINNTLQQLDLSHNQLSSLGIINISKSFLTNTTLQILNISHNDISDDGAVAISECLKANTTLKELNISNNKITSHGIIKIAEAMKMNTTLSSLDVSLNNISNIATEVATALSDHFKQNNTLQVLGISWNNTDTTYVYHVGVNNECYVDVTYSKSYIGWHRYHLCQTYFSSTEATLLAALLHGNVDVKTVKIVRNIIRDTAVSIISDCLKTNTVIGKLELSKNMISTYAIIQILKVSYVVYDHEGYDNIITISTTIQHNRYKRTCVQAHVYRIILQLFYISREYMHTV